MLRFVFIMMRFRIPLTNYNQSTQLPYKFSTILLKWKES